MVQRFSTWRGRSLDASPEVRHLSRRLRHLQSYLMPAILQPLSSLGRKKGRGTYSSSLMTRRQSSYCLETRAGSHWGSLTTGNNPSHTSYSLFQYSIVLTHATVYWNILLTLAIVCFKTTVHAKSTQTCYSLFQYCMLLKHAIVYFNTTIYSSTL